MRLKVALLRTHHLVIGRAADSKGSHAARRTIRILIKVTSQAGVTTTVPLHLTQQTIGLATLNLRHAGVVKMLEGRIECVRVGRGFLILLLLRE